MRRSATRIGSGVTVHAQLSGKVVQRGFILSFEPSTVQPDDNGAFWLSAVIENHTSEAATVRLVHWGGNGVAPVLARYRAPNGPHAGFEASSAFFTIDGGEVEVYPGVPVHVDIQFECVDDGRFIRSKPRSVFALLRDSGGTMIDKALLELPDAEATA